VGFTRWVGCYNTTRDSLFWGASLSNYAHSLMRKSEGADGKQMSNLFAAN